MKRHLTLKASFLPIDDAFGKPTITNGSGSLLIVSAQGNRFMFTGREFLTQVNLYDYRNRVYSADLGRFLQTDPIGFKAKDVNLYRYCGNDPVDKTDPMGLTTCWKRVRMTTFTDKQGAYKQGPLGPNDIAVGNYGAGSNTPTDGQLAPGQTDQPAYPKNSNVGVYPDSGTSFQGTVSDWGSYNIKHPGTPTDGWVDIHNSDHSDYGWISFTVPCKCPSGSVDQSNPFSNN